MEPRTLGVCVGCSTEKAVLHKRPVQYASFVQNSLANASPNVLYPGFLHDFCDFSCLEYLHIIFRINGAMVSCAVRLCPRNLPCPNLRRLQSACYIINSATFCDVSSQVSTPLSENRNFAHSPVRSFSCLAHNRHLRQLLVCIPNVVVRQHSHGCNTCAYQQVKGRSVHPFVFWFPRRKPDFRRCLSSVCWRLCTFVSRA